MDGCSFFEIVDAEKPVLCNPVNYTEKDGHFYAKVWDEAEHAYVTDFSRELPEKNLPLYANAIGCEEMATVANVCIRNVKITNADPRYPILLMGLTDSHLKNITLENIQVEYRGGLTMEHAVEQRQLNTEWKFSQFHAKEHVQNLPWLVNTFFLKNEGLLPRADWNPDLKTWQDDPYNVPELPDVYPEPSNWGILPSYGIFAKHVDGLTLRNIEISTKVPDSRHVCVLDDMKDVVIDGLTADCTQLEIGTHEDKKNGITYENLLYQIRPAFGGNIVATIVNPEHRPQMATVREGVMKKEILDESYQGEVVNHDVAKFVPETDYVVKVIDRHVEKAKHNLKGAPIVIAGGYGMGSKEGFDKLFELAKELHAEVGASRAAVDAGYADHDRQIGQTGVTVRPKLYIACGISGQIQHIAGMQDAGIIISVNSDPNAPINTIADYVINGTVEEVVPKLIKYYKKNSK